MSKVYVADAESAHKEKILSDLKTVVNDLTGIKPENVDIHAHFMEVGIDSLTLIQATQLVKELFDVKLSVVQLLEQLTNLDALASYIAQQVPVQSLPQTAAAPVAAPQEAASGFDAGTCRAAAGATSSLTGRTGSVIRCAGFLHASTSHHFGSEAG